MREILQKKACAALLFIRRRNRLIHLSAVVAYLIGFISNCLAPGNFVRAETIGVANGSTICDIFAKIYLNIKSLYVILTEICDVGLFISAGLYIASILLFVRMLFFNKRKAYIMGTLVFGAFASLSLNLFVGAIYPRALYGFCFISYVSFCLSCSYTIKSFRYRLPTYSLLFALILVLTTCEIPKTYGGIFAMRDMTKHVQKEILKGNHLIQPTDNFKENANSRYMETWGLGNNLIRNHALARYCGGVDFSVLNDKDRSFVEKNKIFLEDIPLCRIVDVDNDYHVIRTKCAPSKILLTSPPVEIPYKISYVRDYVQKRPREVSPLVICLHDSYYVIWEAKERVNKAKIKLRNGETLELTHSR